MQSLYNSKRHVALLLKLLYQKCFALNRSDYTMLVNSIQLESSYPVLNCLLYRGTALSQFHLPNRLNYVILLDQVLHAPPKKTKQNQKI